jgi:Cu/Ag efflux protein CusF/putative intracellular protease/amidase
MKRLLLLAALTLAPGTHAMGSTPTTAASPTPAPATQAPISTGMIKVAIVVSDGANLMDMAGPWEVFQDTSLKDDHGKEVAPYQLYTVAPGKAPLHTEGSNHPGLAITADYGFDDAPIPDIVVVGAQSGGRGLNAWLRKVHAQHKVVLSVCTGAFHLAEAGLLDGKPATTHHWFFGNFQQQFPNVKLVEQVRYVQADPITFTAGGLTSGVDLALHMVADRFGQDVAQQTADYMEYMGTGWKTNQGISVLTTPVTRQTWSGPIANGGRVVLHIVTTGSSPALTVDIPAQHVLAATATPNKTHGHTLGMTVHIPGHPATFTGIMNADGSAVVGSFVQDGQSHPLTLAKQTTSKQAHAPPADVAGIGVIEAIDTANGTLTLQHEPIAALGWPTMTMVLKVAAPDLLTRAKVGDKIRFTLYPDDLNSILTSIKPIKQ